MRHKGFMRREKRKLITHFREINPPLPFLPLNKRRKDDAAETGEKTKENQKKHTSFSFLMGIHWRRLLLMLGFVQRLQPTGETFYTLQRRLQLPLKSPKLVFLLF